MLKRFYFRQLSMATLFEGWLVGEDTDHLSAISQSLKAEILRVEHLLSRHDPRAELARINKEAPHKRVKIERELFRLLEDCVSWYHQTDGYFDIAVSTKKKSEGPDWRLPMDLLLYPKTTQISYQHPTMQLDLGGCGKGYALDQLVKILKAFKVEHFLLHGGKSSFYASGNTEEGKSWKIQLPRPSTSVLNVSEEHMNSFPLEGGFSYSAVFHAREGNSDIIDPFSGNPLNQQLACAVWTPTAVEAEVWSTALLAMCHRKGTIFAKGKAGDRKVELIETQVYES